jgi:hypothetical protein
MTVSIIKTKAAPRTDHIITQRLPSSAAGVEGLSANLTERFEKLNTVMNCLKYGRPRVTPSSEFFVT